MKHIEHDNQVALIKWSDYQTIPNSAEKIGSYLFSIPNGGKRNLITASLLRAEGCKAGVPDLCLAYPNKKYHSLYIEMKAPTKTARLSPTQKEWQEKLNKVGFLAVVCFGFEQAKQTIIDYLENKL